MAKRHFYSAAAGFRGLCTRSSQHLDTTAAAYQNIRCVARDITNYLWTICTIMGGNYVTVATIFVVVALSFLLPDVSKKYQIRKEVKAMKGVLISMNKEVTRAEAACLAVADEICVLHCAVQDDATETPQELRDLSVCTSSSLRETRSEPVQVEKKVGFFHRVFFPNRNASHKEIAIMSFVYTDSFDAHQKPLNKTANMFDI